ncbi:MAG: DUF1549 domain-containing protein [Pedosphaera sp.]|nr:DUF1549 domain-containing protein [Pedosphaera sp.]
MGLSHHPDWTCMQRFLRAILAGCCVSIGSQGAVPTLNPLGAWLFVPPADIAPPQVRAADTVRNGVDAFILARLEEKRLSLSPEATPHILVRRLYLELIGLPPTPAEVEVFVHDTDPKAWGRLVDRLLSDSRYGERWARFWLDLARYADSAGYEGDPDLPHAWRYRDYVIDAFNQDKPYDLFILEEIMGAGDLPEPKPEQTVALTFLRLAPFTEPRGDASRHEMLSESDRDRQFGLSGSHRRLRTMSRSQVRAHSNEGFLSHEGLLCDGANSAPTARRRIPTGRAVARRFFWVFAYSSG